MIHLDGVERAVLGAEAAVHADVGVDVELGGLRDGTSRGRVGAAHDPDALRRADLGADAAGGAADLLFAVRALVIDEERDVAEFLGHGQFLFGILHREDAACVLAGTVGDALRREVAFLARGDAPPQPDEVLPVGVEEAHEGDAQTFE